MVKEETKQENLISTREAYGQALVDLGKKHDHIVVLDAGTSNSTYSELFAKEFPNRYFPMFIAEQNAVGTALGLSKRGYVPFVSSFAAFWTRAHDQIRMASYSQANIKICGSHCGISIGQDGVSQMGLEDLAMFRTIFNSTVLYPSDEISTYQLIQLAFKLSGLVYIRTTRAKTPRVYSPKTKFTIPGFTVLQKSPQDQIAVISSGITVHEALSSYKELDKQGVKARIIDLYCLKPIDVQALVQALSGIKQIVTVEDHYPEGGLGEAVKSALAISQKDVYSLAVNKLPKSGQPKELIAYAGIDSHSITKTVQSLL